MQCSDLGGKVKIFQLDKKLSVSAIVDYPNIFTPIIGARGGRRGCRHKEDIGIGIRHIVASCLQIELYLCIYNIYLYFVIA